MNTNVMYTIIGDLAVNLSAGWLGGLIIIPVKSGKPLKYKVRSLILNLVVIAVSYTHLDVYKRQI